MNDSQQRLWRIIDGSNDGLWEWADFSHDEFWWSSRFYEMLGYEDQAFQPTLEKFMELLHPDDRERVSSELRGRTSEAGVFESEYRLQSRSGKYIWFQARGQTFCDETGRPTSMAGTVRDLTERREAREALERSERLLAHAERLAQVGGFEWDIPQGVVTFSDGWMRIHGVRHRQFGLDELQTVAHSEDLPAIQKAFDEAIVSGRSYAIEHRIVHQQSGEIRWVHARGDVVRDRDGQALTMFGASHDITERMQAEEARRRSQLFLRRALDSLSSHVAILDENGVILTVNEAWRNFAKSNDGNPILVCEGADYFRACEEAEGMDAETARGVLAGIRGVLRGERESFSTEYPCHSPDEKRWFVVHVTPFVDSDPPRVVVTHETITERKLAEEALIQNDRELQAVYDSAPIMMVLVDEHRRIRRANRTALRAARFEAGDELIGQRGGVMLRCIHALRDPEGCGLGPACQTCGIRNMVLDTLETGRSRQREQHKLLVEQDGEEAEIHILGSSVRLSLDHGVHVLLAIEDITDQRKAERSLRQREAELAHLNRIHTVGQMAATLAHELNQPLYAINNYVHGMQRRLRTSEAPHDSESLIGVMDEVSKEVERASGIVSHLREFVRGRIPTRLSLSLAQLLQQAFELLQPLARDKGIVLQLQVPHDLPRVQADPIELEQVVVNLVANALDATAGLPKSRRRVTILGRASNPSEVDVEVRDLGRGVREDLKDRLFEPFVTGKEDGLGVGLAISRSIVNTHGGKIWTADNEPYGTSFHFTLPVRTGIEDRNHES